MKIAIDPGKTGAIAFCAESRMPKIDYENCPSTIYEMIEILEDIKNIAKQADENIFAIIEKVHSMPKQGVKSVWTFATNYSAWKTAMIALRIPFIEVLPNTWMRKVGALPKDKKQRKNALKTYSQQLYPELKVTLKNADALAMLSIIEKL